jgi:phosphatidylinositol alpha-1,6-mannosyltransferase
MAVPCFISSLTKKINYFVAVHGLDAIENRKFNKYIQRKTLNKSKGIIAVSNYTAGLLKNVKLSEELPVEIIPNGVDTNIFKPSNPDNSILKKYNIKPGFRLLSLGRLIERKGFDTTIKAMAKIALPTGRDRSGQAPGDIHYYIAGKGPYENELKELIYKYSLKERVHLLGFIPDEDKSAIYNIADLFVMPSRELPKDVEGFGITYLEAAASGIPSIGGKSSGAEDAIVDEVTGYLVDPMNIDEIADKIIKLYNNRDNLYRLGLNALERARNNFTWEIVSKQIECFINRNIK